MNNTPIIPDDLITPAAAAKLLTTSSASVRRWVQSGKLPGFRLCGQLRVSRADALALLQRVETAGVPLLPTKAEVVARDADDDRILRKYGVRR